MFCKITGNEHNQTSKQNQENKMQVTKKIKIKQS